MTPILISCNHCGSLHSRGVKTPLLCLLATIWTTTVAGHAQIVFGSAQAITGSDNIISAGSLFDAFQTQPGKSSDTTVGSTTFNYGTYSSDNSSFGDGTIVLTPGNSYLGGSGDSFSGTFTTGNSTDNANFQHVLAGTIYTEGTADATINGLTSGHTYQVQVFKATDYSPDTSRNTLISGQATVGGVPVGTATELDTPSFTIGTFTALGSSQGFTYSKGAGGDYGEATAIVVRDITDVPEPAAYAIFGAGFALLLAATLFRRATLV
jgi:hypothetical protein